MTTAKLDSYQRDMRKIYKRELAAQGGGLFSFPDERVTVLVCPSAGPNGNFYQVSVAYCDENDTFRRKVGELLVLERFDEGQSFAVPFKFRDMHAVAYCVVDMIVGC